MEIPSIVFSHQSIPWISGYQSLTLITTNFSEHQEIIYTTQVEDSGHRIPQDPVGKMRESHRILQENTGIP
jgi:hypothetical protein